MAGYRTAYTHEDRMIILQYIIKTQCYNSLRGNAFWQEMEAQKILTRSWQSVKEHFKKKIIDTIHIFNIPQEEKRLIKEGWESSKIVTKDSNGRRVKRPRHYSIPNNFSDEDSCNKYEIIDDSDSSSHSNSKTKPRRRKNRKSSNNVNFPCSFSSDEEDGPTSKRKQIIEDDSSSYDSPDLFNNNANVNKPKQNIKDCEAPSTSSLNQKKFKKNTKLVRNEPDIIDKNSDEITVVQVDLDTTGTSTNIGSENFDEQFSLEEDLLLLNFMKKDKIYLQRRTQLKIYEHFRELYPKSKSAKKLKDRFLNHIFYNVHNYDVLTYEEMCRFYEEAEVDIPKQIKLLTKDPALSPKESKNLDKELEICYSNAPTINANVDDFSMNVCEHELNKSGTDCIYCLITLNGEPHLFVSTETNNKENLISTLSKKLEIVSRNIHFMDFMSFAFLEQVNKFRNTIFKQYGNIITKSLEEYSHDVNVAELISSLEICIQAFSSEDDSSSESSNSSCESSTDSRIINTEETINTQEFNPKENSTPEKRDKMREEEIEIEENEMPQIKIEICSEDSVKSMSPSFGNNAGNDESSDCQKELENNKSKTNQNEPSKETSICLADNSKNDECENINVIKNDKSKSNKNDSQYLQSVSTQESCELRNALVNMTDEARFFSIDMPSSSEAFHTALSQDFQ